MPLIEFQDYSFTYPSRRAPSLRGVSLAADEGEFVLVAGRTGSGKSTLARAACGLLARSHLGVEEGEILLLDRRFGAWNPVDIPRHVAVVFQDPSVQALFPCVLDEVLFAPRRDGLSEDHARGEALRALEDAALQPHALANPATLSGGQKQRLALAAALSGQPRLLVLDEPTSQLDPLAAARLVAALGRAAKERGPSVLCIEHRVERFLPVADRVVLLDEGAVVLDAPRKEALVRRDIWNRLDLDPGALTRLAWASDVDPDAALTDPRLLEERAGGASSLLDPLGGAHERRTPGDAQPVVRVHDLCCRYRGAKKDALRDASVEFHGGCLTAVVGVNGSGKSTLVGAVAGLMKPRAGLVEIAGCDVTRMSPARRARMVATVLQDPDCMLVRATVREDVGFRAGARGGILLPGAQVDEAMRLLGIADLAGQPPFSLSRGQRQRVAVAGALAARTPAVFIDEPTTGQDRRQVRAVFHALTKRARENGVAVVVVTHDMEAVLEHADRVVVLDAGSVTYSGDPAGFVHRGLADLGGPWRVAHPPAEHSCSTGGRAQGAGS